MSKDHTGWLKVQKFKQTVQVCEPLIFNQQAQRVKYVSPKASSAPKIDLFATESGKKACEVKETQKSLLVPATSSEANKKRSRKNKHKNDFFLASLGA